MNRYQNYGNFIQPINTSPGSHQNMSPGHSQQYIHSPGRLTSPPIQYGQMSNQDQSMNYPPQNYPAPYLSQSYSSNSFVSSPTQQMNPAFIRSASPPPSNHQEPQVTYDARSNQLNSKIKELESALQSTRSERIKKMSSVDFLREEEVVKKDLLFNQIKSLQSKIQELTQQNHQLKTMLDKKTNEITISKSIEEKLSLVINENEKLIEITQAKEAKIMSILNSQKELRDNLEDATNALQEANETILALESKIEELLHENNRLNTYLEQKSELNSEIQKLASICSKLESKNVNSEKQIERLKADLKSKEKEIEEIFHLKGEGESQAHEALENQNNEILSLNDCLIEKSNEIDNLQSELFEAKNELDRMAELLQKVQESNTNLIELKEQELRYSESETSDLRKIICDYEEKIHQLLSENEKLNELATSLDENFKLEISRKQEELDNFENTIESLNFELITKGDEIQKSVEIHNELVQALENSKSEISRLRIEIKNYKGDKDDKNSKIQGLIDQNQRLNELLESKSKEIKELVHAKESESHKAIAPTQENLKLKLELEGVLNENKELKSALHSLETQEHMMRTLQEDCRQFETKFTEILEDKQSSDSKVIELQAVISDLENSLTSKEVSYTQLQKKCTVLEKALKDIEWRSKAQAKEVIKTAEDKKILEKEISNLQSLYSRQTARNESHGNSIYCSTTDPFNSASDYDNFESQLEHWKSINENNKEEIKKLYSLLKARKVDLDAFQSKVPALEAKNKDLESSNNELETMNELQRSQIAQLEEVVTKQDKEVMNLRKNIENYARLYKEVSRDLNDKKEENEKVKSKYLKSLNAISKLE